MFTHTLIDMPVVGLRLFEFGILMLLPTPLAESTSNVLVGAIPPESTSVV
jgi:hypothetical protein